MILLKIRQIISVRHFLKGIVKQTTSKNTFFVSLYFFTSYSWCLNPTLISNKKFSAFGDILYIPCP